MDIKEKDKPVIYVDIDDTICTQDGHNYKEAKPLYERIAKINDLYNRGWYVIYWTARGTKTGKDWTKVTEMQLNKWLVKYHELRFGKPVYDLFVDDKNINSERFFNE